MTEQIELAIEEQNPTRWQKLLAWLTRFDEAMNYDPQVHANARIRYLSEGLERLESRVNEPERSS